MLDERHTNPTGVTDTRQNSECGRVDARVERRSSEGNRKAAWRAYHSVALAPSNQQSALSRLDSLPHSYLRTFCGLPPVSHYRSLTLPRLIAPSTPHSAARLTTIPPVPRRPYSRLQQNPVNELTTTAETQRQPLEHSTATLVLHCQLALRHVMETQRTPSDCEVIHYTHSATQYCVQQSNTQRCSHSSNRR